MPDEYYYMVLPSLGNAIRAPHTFHIISEGNWSEKMRLSWEKVLVRRSVASVNASVRFHLDTDMLEAAAHLAEADMLVLSPSSFSTSMAHFNLGLLALPEHTQQNTDVFSDGGRVWCGELCGSGLSASSDHRERAMKLPAWPSCTCMEEGLREHVKERLTSDKYAGKDRGEWLRRIRMPPDRFLHLMSRSKPHADHRCTLVCAPDGPAPRDLSPSQWVRFRETLRSLSCQIEALAAWKASTRRLALPLVGSAHGWMSVGSLLLGAAGAV